ncbi:MAG: molybdenum cofactor biosynthesis protein B [Candidatus Brocadiia bacterium]
MDLKVAVLVTSDRIAAGKAEDKSGKIAREILRDVGEVVEKCVVPDETEEIRESLLAWCGSDIDIIVTIGGTGLSPRDRTAEVTASLIEKEASGISCALIMRGLQDTPKAMLSCGTAGIHNDTLIVNLPGSTSAVEDYLEYLRDVLPHAVEMMHGGGH